MPQNLFDEGLKEVKTLGIRLVQHEDEFYELFKKVHALQPKVYVQIGSFQGACEIVLSRACEEHAVIISIDNETAGRTGESRIPALQMSSSKLCANGFRAFVIQGNSEHKDTIQGIKNLLIGLEIDFLYIDGGHSFDQSLSDFNNYKGFVREDGLIAIHDINENCGKDVSTPMVWRLIKQDIQYKTEEIILCEKDGGVGMVWV